jgi:hypothetical protein
LTPISSQVQGETLFRCGWHLLRDLIHTSVVTRYVPGKAIIMPITINIAHKKDPKSLTNYQFFQPILSTNLSGITLQFIAWMANTWK